MRSRYSLPIAILIAGLTVAAGLAISKLQSGEVNAPNEDELLSNISPILSTDYYLGNPKAEVILIEYSDYDCLFCSSHYNNLRRIIEELGKGGELAWVHRHMPLYQIHPTSKEKALAAECAGKIGGEEKFWTMSDALYKMNIEKRLVTIATLADEQGLDMAGFNACLGEGDLMSKIEDQYDEAFRSGARGTPFTVIIKGDKRYAVAESLPYFELRSLVESLIAE